MITKFFIKRDTGFYVLILLLATLFCIPAFNPGKAFYAFDTLNHYYPRRSLENTLTINNILITDPINAFYPPHFLSAHKYFQDSLHEGNIPLWYKNILCGLPFYSYYTGPVFITFYSLFSIQNAHDLLLFFHLVAAGLFTFLFMRKIGLCKLASLVSSIAWMFNGHIMVWFEFEHLLMLAAILPATLLFVEKYFAKRTFVSWLMIIFCFGYTFSE